MFFPGDEKYLHSRDLLLRCQQDLVAAAPYTNSRGPALTSCCLRWALSLCQALGDVSTETRTSLCCVRMWFVSLWCIEVKGLTIEEVEPLGGG